MSTNFVIFLTFLIILSVGIISALVYYVHKKDKASCVFGIIILVLVMILWLLVYATRHSKNMWGDKPTMEDVRNGNAHCDTIQNIIIRWNE